MLNTNALYTGVTTMKLTYRGNEYTVSPTALDIVETQIQGMFREQSYAIHQSSAIQAEPAADLTYRGIHYNRRPDERIVDSQSTVQLLRSRAANRHHPAFR
jgi:hypothetical protein